MAKVLVTESYLEDIGDAIRAKLETQDTYKPSQMANAIGQISGGATLISKSITENGTYDASDDEADGYSSVTVNVAGGGGSGPILSGTTEPTSAIGNNEDIYIKYSEMPAVYDHSIKIDAYRKVNGVWENYTEPEASTKGVHIWTKSTGGNDAAMYVQNGYWDVDNDIFVATGDVVSVIYTSVQSINTYNCNGIATLGYPSNWKVYATDSVTDGTNTFASGDEVKTWRYNVSVDFYVWKNV